MSQLVRLEGKHTWQNAHCAMAPNSSDAINVWKHLLPRKLCRFFTTWHKRLTSFNAINMRKREVGILTPRWEHEGICPHEGQGQPAEELACDLPPIAQGKISMSVAVSTHVWKIPNICKYIIVWLFSHMCAFFHTCVPFPIPMCQNPNMEKSTQV